MIIDKIQVKKFRGFENVEFAMGSHLTAIAGQNGTQKTTILGMLTQSFSITEEDHPMIEENPLSGGNYKSSFSDKFKLSETFDNAGEHEWTLHFKDSTPPYTIESINRDKAAGTIRFWQKGNKSKGSGYVQLPVIYLSLKRLLPIAEDPKLKEDQQFKLDQKDFGFYSEWFNKILILTRESDKVLTSSVLSSTNKKTIGANTDHYDWKSNSAGQDNLSNIILSVLSFKKLMDKYGNDYRGGILAIDELDASFYPGSQVKLIDALFRFAADYKIQIIFTTHSLTILEKIDSINKQIHRSSQAKIMFLKKLDSSIEIKSDIDYSYIKNHLNRTLTGSIQTNKINVYTEDQEGAIFAKSLLGTNRTKHLNFVKVNLGCGNLIQLATVKIPEFTFPNSMIILDGDVKSENKNYKKCKKLKNVVILPTDKSPEQIISQFLYDLSDSDPLWSKIDVTFDHQFCFENYSNQQIQNDRNKAKKWFNDHIKLWGRNASKVMNEWKAKNKDQVQEFNDNFDKMLIEYKKKINL
jgi:AAA15 family ATPase/GTPase